MTHGQLDSTRADLLRPRSRAPGEVNAGFRTSTDLDLLPGEVDARPQRLPHRLLGREPPSVVLRGVRLRIAVRALRCGEAALGERAPVPAECAPDAVDLDQVDADAQLHDELAVALEPVGKVRDRGHDSVRGDRRSLDVVRPEL